MKKKYARGFFGYVENTQKRIISKLLSDHAGIKTQQDILDLGCGEGLKIDLLCRFGHVVGLEISKTRLKRVSQDCSSVNFILGSAEYLPFRDEVFQIIICVDVLEHLLDYRVTLVEVRRIMKSSGLLLTTIYHKLLNSIIRLMLLTFPLVHPEHTYFPSYEDVNKCFQGTPLHKRFYPQCGCSVILLRKKV